MMELVVSQKTGVPMDFFHLTIAGRNLGEFDILGNTGAFFWGSCSDERKVERCGCSLGSWFWFR